MQGDGAARKRGQYDDTEQKVDAPKLGRKPFHDVANEKPWDAAPWCPNLHFLAKTIFKELDITLERRVRMRNAVDAAGFHLIHPDSLRGGQMFAAPRADMFKGEPGTVSRMFVTYIMLEPLFLEKAIANPYDLKGFTRGEWRSVLKGFAGDWHFNTQTWDRARTEDYVKVYGLQQLYDSALQPPVIQAPIISEEQRPSLPASANALLASSRASDPYRYPAFTLSVLDGELGLRPESERAELQPNGWCAKGPGQPTGPRNFEYWAFRDYNFDRKEAVFNFIGHNGGKRTTAASEAEDVWELYDLGSVFLFFDYAHPAKENTTGEQIFTMRLHLVVGGGKDRLLDNVRVWHGHKDRHHADALGKPGSRTLLTKFNRHFFLSADQEHQLVQHQARLAARAQSTAAPSTAIVSLPMPAAAVTPVAPTLPAASTTFVAVPVVASSLLSTCPPPVAAASSSSSALPQIPLRVLLRPAGETWYMGHLLPVYNLPDDATVAKGYNWLPDTWKRFLAWRIHSLCFCLELLHVDMLIRCISCASAAGRMRSHERLSLLYAVLGGTSPMVDVTRFTHPNWRKRLPAIKALHALVVGWERADTAFPSFVASGRHIRL